MPHLAAMRRLLACLILSVLASLAPLTLAAQGTYPAQPITLIVPWQTGSGADAMGRLLASLLTRELGQPVQVRNRPEGNGVNGHEAIAAAAPDGYTIGLVTTELAMMHWLDRTEITHESVTPLALIGRDPAAILVRAESRIDDVRELRLSIRGKGRALRASGTAEGGIWHLALAGMARSLGLPPQAVTWVPTSGAAPAFERLLADEVVLVIAAIPEASSLLNAGLVRGLAVMDATRNPGYPDIPTLQEAADSDWTAAAWTGVAGPAGLPDAVRQELVDALRLAYDSEEFRAFMSQRGFTPAWLGPDDFAAFMAASDAALGAALPILRLTR